jgi:hypothetical protein
MLTCIRRNWICLQSILMLLSIACKKDSNPPLVIPPVAPSFSFTSLLVNGSYKGFTYYNVNDTPQIRFLFSAPIDHASVNNNIAIKDNTGLSVSYSSSFGNNDSMVIIQPAAPLKPITQYLISVSTGLSSQLKGNLQSPINVNLITAIDSTNKFPLLTDSALLTLVEEQTFKYFWDFGHPVSGLARERNTSADVVTAGGSGFGLMSMIVGIQRNFITRSQGLTRMELIVNFLSTQAQRYHGAFAHWMNGATGATIPFSAQDDGADLVETSYLMQGLLCARQFFNSGTDAGEISLRNNINNLWNAVEWSWFRQNGQDKLYWHWSPDNAWAINMPIQGWNEAMIVYVLAAASNTFAIPKTVYDNGWAQNGAMKNGNTYFGYQLPLGPALGGPLFFAHYSFLGINPNNLSDAYADYWLQNSNHTLINYSYCKSNPKNFNGYSDQCWGLTASDENSGYSAHDPVNDDGVITPSAAISSIPYTPTESMNAIRFFYYKLGNKIWGQYGFTDAFNLSQVWFANSFLAIDQGPQIIMIENYRSGLLWNLFMSCPEIKTGMTNLGFQSPNLN